MGRARLLIEKGDTLTTVIDWDNPDGTPVDLTGYTVTCNITVGSIVFNLTEAAGLTVVDLTGKITLTLTDEQTDTFVTQYGTWRLKVESPGGAETTLAEGLVFVSM